MAEEILSRAWSRIDAYLKQNYTGGERETAEKEISGILGGRPDFGAAEDRSCSYEEVQAFLASLNEKGAGRKSRGVYYTPQDVVRFILEQSVRLGREGEGRKPVSGPGQPAEIPFSFCLEQTVYDPTCGSGVFLLAALEMKLDLLDSGAKDGPAEKIRRAVASIRGNDLNPDSVAIAKARLFLCVLHRYGAAAAEGLADTLKGCFTCYDYVERIPGAQDRYDFIIGNPPYIEDTKSESVPQKKYGNIYANVLENAAMQLKPGGVLGFVIPLSYVATPRMKKIREALYQTVPQQYIFSYADRPDCLFASVHQKLCILFGKNRKGERRIFTSNYRYWYREERPELFRTLEWIENAGVEGGYIPKLGTASDASVYRKVAGFETPLLALMEKGTEPVYLNMRAAFWIKAFRREHAGSEYQAFWCENPDMADFCMCLLHSSLFWWYWICVSDCWHITRKELQGFKVPQTAALGRANRLAARLEERLEETKTYVGTKQTEYEYKHKACVDVIHQIDDYIHGLYGLTEEEGRYIKNFAFRYRIGGGAESGRN